MFYLDEDDQYMMDLDGGRDPRDVSVTTMVKEFSKVTDQTPEPYLYMTLINEEYTELLDSDTMENELKELADLVYVIYGYALAMDYNLEEAIRRVHENNIGRCVQPDGTVKRREDGKIMKNPDHPPVDLGGLY